MPALNASSKPTVSATTLNARSTVFQPGGSTKAAALPLTVPTAASPLGANNGNSSNMMDSSPLMMPQQHQHHHHSHHHHSHHHHHHKGMRQQQHVQRRGRGRSRGNSQQQGYRDFRQLFYAGAGGGGTGGRSEYDYESTSILKMHDELPPQAIEAWNRFRARKH